MSGEVELIFDVHGMHCASCGMLVDAAIEGLPGVKRASTNVRKGRTVVLVNPGTVSPDAIIESIALLGYEARVALEPAAGGRARQWRRRRGVPDPGIVPAIEP